MRGYQKVGNRRNPTRLVGSKTVVKFHNANLISPLPRCETSLSKNFIGTPFRHTIPDYFHCTPGLEGSWVICLEPLCDNLNSLVLELMSVHEIL